MAEAEAWLRAKAGMHFHQLPNYDWRGEYKAGTDPREAAANALLQN